MQVFNRNVSVRGLTVFGFEVFLISGSMALAANLHGSFSAADTPDAMGTTLWKIALVTALCQLCFYYNDLYDLTVVHSNRELVVRLLQAAGAAAIVLAAAGLAVPSLILDPGTFVTALGVFVVAVLTWRITFNHFAHDPHLEERVLILGTGHTARRIAQQIGMPAGLRVSPRRLRQRPGGRHCRPAARHPRRHRRHRSAGQRQEGGSHCRGAVGSARVICRFRRSSGRSCRACASRTRPRPTSG